LKGKKGNFVREEGGGSKQKKTIDGQGGSDLLEKRKWKSTIGVKLIEVPVRWPPAGAMPAQQRK